MRRVEYGLHDWFACTRSSEIRDFNSRCVHHRSLTKLTGCVRVVYKNLECDLAHEGRIIGQLKDAFSRSKFTLGATHLTQTDPPHPQAPPSPHPAVKPPPVPSSAAASDSADFKSNSAKDFKNSFEYINPSSICIV